MHRWSRNHPARRCSRSGKVEERDFWGAPGKVVGRVPGPCHLSQAQFSLASAVPAALNCSEGTSLSRYPSHCSLHLGGLHTLSCRRAVACLTLPQEAILPSWSCPGPGPLLTDAQAVTLRSLTCPARPRGHSSGSPSAPEGPPDYLVEFRIVPVLLKLSICRLLTGGAWLPRLSHPCSRVPPAPRWRFGPREGESQAHRAASPSPPPAPR